MTPRTLLDNIGRSLPAWVLASLLGACAQQPSPVTEPTDGAAAQVLNVFAAASLKESMDAATMTWRTETGHPVQVSYAGTSTLARQLEQGAPADVFVSADSQWMDWAQERKLIDPATRHDLLGNTLVLIAPADSSAQPLTLGPDTELLPLLGNDGRIALALTASVPAGKYAKAAFESLGLWGAIEPRTAEAENVRAALLLVARGEAPLGVVYGSDALAEPRVKVLATFQEASHPMIVYPVARVAASTHPDADGFVQWLQSDQAGTIFSRHGFTLR